MRCSKAAIPGGTVCRYHGGAAPQVQNKARQRILAAADPVARELIRLATDSDSDAVRRQACSDLLDRAGLAAATKLEISGEVSIATTIRERRRARMVKSKDKADEPEVGL